MDKQWMRITGVVGDGKDASFDEMVATYYEHLSRSLDIPCAVKGIEDFNWEEPYVFGVRSAEEYARLRKERPSYRDICQLLAIENGAYSQWMLFSCDDIGAYVRRESDGKEFLLGLAELVPVDKKSRNYQLLRDYAVFFVNSR